MIITDTHTTKNLTVNNVIVMHVHVTNELFNQVCHEMPVTFRYFLSFYASGKISKYSILGTQFSCNVYTTILPHTLRWFCCFLVFSVRSGYLFISQHLLVVVVN